MTREISEREVSHRRPERVERSAERAESAGQPAAPRPRLWFWQRLIGNRAVQRFLIQRSGNAAFDLDDETALRIDRERGGGHALDRGVGESAGARLGYDLGDVRVHTSPEADALSRELSAQAFTTGRDIFFRAGAYDPGSSGGRELIGHELTHVVQQATGAVGGGAGGGMTVNPPDDAFERAADAASRGIGAPPSIQRQATLQEEEERAIQTQEEDEEEEEKATQ